MVDTRKLEQLLRVQEPARGAERRPSRGAALAGAGMVVPAGAVAAPNARTRAAWQALVEAVSDTPGRGGAGHNTQALGAQAQGVGLPAAFDMLRTQMLQASRTRGWRNVGITGPDTGCGASFVTANLAASFGRLGSVHTVALDLDLANPSLARDFGLRPPGPISAMIDGSALPGEHLVRMGETLALGLSTGSDGNPSTLFQNGAFGQTLAEITQEFAPDIVLCDLPPMLGSDTVITLLAELDAVLLVADGTRTLARDLQECEALLHEKAQLLGIILNRGADRAFRRFARR